VQITDKMAVSIHYTLTNDQGEVLDSSIGNEALSYLHGMGNIITGLEQALLNKVVGDKFKVRIEPEDGYGAFDESKVQVLARELFSGVDAIEPGMQFHADLGEGHSVITVINVEGDEITVDANHPLAGEALIFDVEVMAIRPASAEEIAHGHIHGEGGHHH